MKRCPECRRDYIDDSLLYCLEDGAVLIQGSVPSPEESATAIMRETVPFGDPAEEKALTRARISTTDRTAILRYGTEAERRGIVDDPSEKQSFSTNRAAKPLAAVILAVLVLLGGFFGYRYFTTANSKQIESIAVMPFVNESGNADVEYLSDGMTETLIKNLSQLPNLAVKSRSTVFYYKGKETSPKKIGEELGVQAVLLGRVDGRGDELKLSLELVNTQTQNVIWAEQYDRRRADVVSLQSEIAKDVSGKLKSKLSGTEEAKVTKAATADPEAYQAYLKGRYYWNRRTAENIGKSIEQFKIATDRDPNYALAYAGLADCYAVLNYFGGTPSSTTIPQAKIFAERAVALDDQLGEPHATLGVVGDVTRQWAEAEREYKLSIQLNPTYAVAYHWYSNHERNLGRTDEAAALMQKAHEIDPVSSSIGSNLAEMYQVQNNFQMSIETARKVIELDPSYPSVYRTMGLSKLKLGLEREAISDLEKAVALSDRAGFALMPLGYAYGVTGNRIEANAILKELEAKYSRSECVGREVAGVFAGLGDKNNTFEWLEKDLKNNEDLADFRWEIPFESLRGDPRFKEILRQLNLPE